MDNISVKLLKKVLSIQSISKEDQKIINYIKSFILSNKLSYNTDEYGNIYVIKGNAKAYPCVVAHVDTVHKIINDMRIFQSGEILFSMDNEKAKQCGIGGDDKVGVFIILQLLLNDNVKNLKAVFFKDEEVGRLGSIHSITKNKDFYSDCNYVLQCDRLGRSDLITNISGVKITSEEFIKDLKEIDKNNHYKEAYGIVTDVYSLVTNGIGISCVNISCGFFSPHSDYEVVNIDDVKKTYNFVYDIITNIHKKYEHKYTEKKYDYYYKGKSNNKNWSSNDNYLIYGYKKNGFYLTKKEKYKFDMMSTDNSDCVLVPEKFNKCCNCSSENTLYIDLLTEKNDIYCIKCGRYLTNDCKKKIYKELVLIDNSNEAVYSTALNSWLNKKEAIFNANINSYIVKS